MPTYAGPDLTDQLSQPKTGPQQQTPYYNSPGFDINQPVSLAPGTDPSQAGQVQRTQPIATMINQMLAPGKDQQAIQVGDINTQIGLQGASYQNQAQLLQQQLGFLGQQTGLSRSGLDISGQSLADQLAHLKAQYGYGVNDAWSNATARGAVNTSGFGGPQGQLARLAEGYQYDTKQLQHAKDRLSLQYKQLGLTDQEGRAKMQNAINQLGLQNALTVDQLEQQISQVIAGGYSPVISILGQLMGAGAPIAGLFNQS